MPIDTNISKDAFIEAQLNDSSLTRFFENADLEFPEHSGNPLASWFVHEDGLLYRMVKSSDETKPLSQLMVPTSLRLKVLRLGHESVFAGQLGVKKHLTALFPISIGLAFSRAFADIARPVTFDNAQ